jgi:hypothetical protein
MRISRYGSSRSHALLHTRLALLLVGAACSESLPTEPVLAVDLANLTGVAAQSVGANGQFVLPIHGANAAAEITGDNARKLATAFVADAGSDFTDALQKDRGAPIHFAGLRPCARAYYVESAYVDVPATVPDLMHKELGPQWLVGLCYGDVEEVSVAVSAYATDAVLDADGVSLVDGGDGNFLVMGVPVGAEIPMAPEGVANLAAQSSKRRVALVPRLIMRPRPEAAMLAIWQVTLEASVTVLGTDTHTLRSEASLFAGPANGWLSPAFIDARPGAPENSLPDSIEYLMDNGKFATLVIARSPGLPVNFEVVTFTGT